MRRLLPFAFFVLLAVGCGDDTAPGGASTDVGADAWSADAWSADAGADATADATSDAGADTGLVLPERPWPVTEAGPFQPAYREMEVTYTPKRETEPRTLRLAVWYPTDRAPEGNEFALYYDLLRRYGIVDAGPIAPAAMADGPMPLLVFSHGNAAMAEQSFFMTEFFASHGWVVVSPDHTGNTVRDTGGAINLTSAVYRPQDISAVIDHVLGLDDDPLAGQIDADKIALSGHSFGGFTTLAVIGASFAVDELMADCEAGQADDDICSIFQDNDAWLANFREGFFDERVKIGIPQAPGGYTAFRDGITDIRVPTLLMTGQMDSTTPNDVDGDPIWDRLDGADDLRVDFMTAGHFTFSNMCDYFGGIEQVADDGCNSEFIDPADAYTIINAFALAYARLHLFGDDHAADILRGDRVVEGGYELSDKQ